MFLNGVTKRDSLTFDLPAGSVWIRASALHPNTPFGQFIGMRVTGGTATFTIAPTVSGATLRVSPAASLSLELDPEPPGAPSNFDPPSKARMSFDADSLTDSTAERVRISAYGAVVEIIPAGLPSFESGRLHFTGDLTILNTAASIDASLIHLSGDWSVERAFWTFNVEFLNANALREALNAGFGTLHSGPGLNLSWTGRPIPVPLAGPVAIVSRKTTALTSIPAATGGRQPIVDEDGATLAQLRFDNLNRIFYRLLGHPE